MAPRTKRLSKAALGRFLEETYARLNRAALTDYDPIAWPRRFSAKEDQEVTGYIAASLAFGNVTSILSACERAIGVLGAHPAEHLRTASDETLHRLSRGFNHRWIFEDDLYALYVMLRGALMDQGGLEPLFAAGMTEDAPDVRRGAGALVEALGGHLSVEARNRRGTKYLLPQTSGPSAAKRMHMFLRWMVRADTVDLGLWTCARPSQLLMPLDTHVARISRELGLTKRKTAGLGMVLEITQRLREIDAEDPIRFDFALSRLGILKDNHDIGADDD